MLNIISIHAPVKGATDNFEAKTHSQKISIHAPVKGATESYAERVVLAVISIHAPVKGATKPCLCFFISTIISIHAPVKGATIVTSKKSLTLSYFNPRTREGCDVNLLFALSSTILFQSTHP